MGCRERTRGAINLFGSRPAGIYTAGTAQRLINIDGYMPGKTVVILGSGDIGLIVARRYDFRGSKSYSRNRIITIPTWLKKQYHPMS